MFRTIPLSIIRSFSLYTQQWYMSYRFVGSLRAGSERNWIGSAAYIFRTIPVSIIRSFSLYTQQWYMSYRFVDSLRAGSERSWIGSAAAAAEPIQLRSNPARKLSTNLYDIYHCCVYSEKLLMMDTGIVRNM